MKAIYKKQYSNYEDALKLTNLTTIDIRRKKMCLKFAEDCLKFVKLKHVPIKYKR